MKNPRNTRPARPWFAAAVAVGLACSDTGASYDTDGEPVPTSIVREVYEGATPRLVDLLFVVDDSSSMAAEATTWALNLRAFVAVLQDPSIDAGARIGVVRTSGTNCGAPVASAVTTSCRARLSEFTSAADTEGGAQNLADACTANCLHESLAFAGTSTHVDAEDKPRPWLEFYAGTSNLEDQDIPADEAFACLGQVGISGCDYEAPLDALARVMEGSHDPASQWYGFIRPSAHFMAVVVSDEDDCSTQDASILDPDGARVFWPAAATGTRAPSATCFRAGSACAQVDNTYECEAVDRQANGELSQGEAPVLRPLGSIGAHFDELRDMKVGNGTPASVGMAFIGGVDPMGSPNWPLGGDAQFVNEYGIAPGCEANPSGLSDPQAWLMGISPPRLLELSAELSANSAFSICNNDYSSSLGAVGGLGGPGLMPLCFDHCVADADPQSPALEHTCTVVVEYEDITESVPECVKDEGGYVIDAATQSYSPPADAPHCFALMADASGEESPDPYDDLASECVDQGAPLELKVAVRPGAAIAPISRRYELACVEDLSPGACDPTP